MNRFGLETLVTLPSTLNLANGNEKATKWLEGLVQNINHNLKI